VDNSELRRSDRIPYGSMAEIAKDGLVRVCKLKDISETGFRIDYVEDFVIGDKIATTLFYGDDKLHVEAEVMWEDVHAGIGFKIMNVIGGIEHSGI